MFDIGWTEILILAVVSLFVIGPKDIPKFLGYIGRLIGKIRGITSDFRETVDDAIKNSELEDIRKEISFTDQDLSNNLNEIINPTKKKNNDQKIDSKESEKKDVNEGEKEISKVDISKEDFPSGLRHIRDNNKSSKKET